jgi:hypothetical protein
MPILDFDVEMPCCALESALGHCGPIDFFLARISHSGDADSTGGVPQRSNQTLQERRVLLLPVFSGGRRFPLRDARTIQEYSVIHPGPYARR